MAYELLGAAGLTIENKQFYDGLLIRRAIPNFAHTNLHSVKKNIPGRRGNSIEFRGMARLTGTTGALTEGTPGAEIQITFTNVTATVLQYGKYIILTDLVEMQAIDDVISEDVEAMGEQMGDTRDLLARNVIVGGTTVQYASTATTRGGASGLSSGMRISWAELREAVQTLERNNAKRFEDGTWHSIIHPDTKFDLFGDATILDNFQEAAQKGPDNPLFTGELGTVFGIKFFESSNADIQSSSGVSGADVYRTALMGRNYLVETELDALAARTIIHGRGSGGVADPLDQRATVAWKMAYVGARLNNNFAVVIEHTTSRSNAA